MLPLKMFLCGEAPRHNPARRLRISLARRLVESTGAPFVSTGETFADAASALDELGLMPSSQGPTIVRVQVEGGTAEVRKVLAGDWFCDPDAGAHVTHLPVPTWHYNYDAKAWIGKRAWLEAWETCAISSWMLHAASEASVDQNLVALAACACARTALPFIPPGEERPLRAIEAAERCARSEGPDDVQRAIADLNRFGVTPGITPGAFSAAYPATRAAHFAAAHAAFAPPEGSRDAADAAAYAAAAHDTPRDPSARTKALGRAANLVRTMIPTLTVLRAVATRA